MTLESDLTTILKAAIPSINWATIGTQENAPCGYVDRETGDSHRILDLHRTTVENMDKFSITVFLLPSSDAKTIRDLIISTINQATATIGFYTIDDSSIKPVENITQITLDGHLTQIV